MSKIRLQKPRNIGERYAGEKWRHCAVCSVGSTETNEDTDETNWYGRMYPESMMTYRDGKWYCNVHYRWKFRKKDMDDAGFEMDDGDREMPVKGHDEY